MKLIVPLTLILLAFSGCNPARDAQDNKKPSKIDPLQDTIGSLCELTGYAAVRVSGYSLVWGLPGTGSSECDPTTKAYLIQQIRQNDLKQFMSEEYQELTAEQIFDSRNTAAVEVTGLVPAGAPEGIRFDVQVRPIQGTQTTSLQGGFLLRTEMRQFFSGRFGADAGRVAALAGGPMFVNPFPIGPEPNQKADPRNGLVLGGGLSKYDRQIALTLINPDYRIAQQIQRRINTRFGRDERPKVANATGREFIMVTLPDEYRDRYQYFISLVMALYIQESSGFEQMTLRNIDQWLTDGQIEPPLASLLWQGIGRGALASISRHYQEGSDQLTFQAAQAALELEDFAALDTMIKIAKQKDNPLQLQAAQTLTRHAEDLSVRRTLSDMLDNQDARLRLIAYEGLRNANDSRVRSINMPGHFQLDLVASAGEDLIGVWATTEPRIALFGTKMKLADNVFYESPDGTVMINAPTGSENVKIVITEKGRLDGITVESSRLVADFVARLTLPDKDKSRRGMGFSQIIGLLYQLSADQQNMIEAKYMLERMPLPGL